MKLTNAEQIVVGTKVRCIYKGEPQRINKTGIISCGLNANTMAFYIKWDDGLDYHCVWYWPDEDLFEIIEEEKPTTKACSHCGCHNKFEFKECWYCKKAP